MKNRLFKMLSYWALAIMTTLVLFTSCKDDDDNGGNPIIVEDGLYVKGGATAVDALDFKGLMTVAKNEVTKENRSTLYELYIAVSNSSDGFNIIHVAGSETKTYGPGADFGLSTEEWETDEPDTTFYRGSYTETTTPFTVSTSGLYHVVIDTELGKVAIAPVAWGIIGGATEYAWSSSTNMPSSGFDLNKISFELTNLKLMKNDCKFRYSDGWKIDFDTTIVHESTEDKGVKVNTNFGGTIDELVSGGDNIAVSESGYYDVSLTWELGVGHTASLIKVGDVELVDWTNAVLDMVGDGISGDNATAYDDTSSWDWGNAILPGNDGKPLVDGQIYTWTWNNVQLIEEQGFKVRSQNGDATLTNDILIDEDLANIDRDNSSSLVKEGDGDMMVTAAGTFNIEVVIDAANDNSIKITITETIK